MLSRKSTLVAVAGAAAGLVLARFADSAVMNLLSTRTDPIVLDVGIDWRTLGFNALIVCVTTMAFALAPGNSGNAARADRCQRTRFRCTGQGRDARSPRCAAGGNVGRPPVSGNALHRHVAEPCRARCRVQRARRARRKCLPERSELSAPGQGRRAAGSDRSHGRRSRHRECRSRDYAAAQWIRLGYRRARHNTPGGNRGRNQPQCRSARTTSG